MSEPKNRMPIVFVGHGNPMNAIADNAYTRTLVWLGEQLPRPTAILCISAHWLTKGTFVTHMNQPKTIHDFYGFPEELFSVQYRAPGAPGLAELVRSTINDLDINLDDVEWGLDHGAWAVLCKMFPEARIPVVQLSIDMSKSPNFHFELGRKLQQLRDQGILILGSGNIVHNLRILDWKKPNEGFDWAIEFNEWVKERLRIRDFKSLVEDFHHSKSGQLSIPTLEHYLPLLYIAGASYETDVLKFQFEGFDMGSISLLSPSASVIFKYFPSMDFDVPEPNLFHRKAKANLHNLLFAFSLKE